MCTWLNNNNCNVLWAPLVRHFFVESSLCVDRCQRLFNHYVLALQLALTMVSKKKCNTVYPNTLFALNIYCLYIHIFVPSHKYVSKYRIPTVEWEKGIARVWWKHAHFGHFRNPLNKVQCMLKRGIKHKQDQIECKILNNPYTYFMLSLIKL